MFTTNRSVLQVLMIIVALSVFVGCSSTGKKPTGASARAEKGMMSEPTGEGEMIERGPMTGTPIPLDQLARDKGITNLCARIHFDYDKSEIKPEFVECMDNVAAFLSAYPDVKVLIEGHCDERGTQEYNIALGEKRAMSTMNYLTAKGIPSSRFTIRSKGEEEPLELGSNEMAWKQNRRAEFFAIQ